MQELFKPLQEIVGEAHKVAKTNNYQLQEYNASRILQLLPDAENDARCADIDQKHSFLTLIGTFGTVDNPPTHPEILAVASQMWGLVRKNCPHCTNETCGFRDK